MKALDEIHKELEAAKKLVGKRITGTTGGIAGPHVIKSVALFVKGVGPLSPTYDSISTSQFLEINGYVVALCVGTLVFPYTEQVKEVGGLVAGDHVNKNKGYPFPGVVVAVFNTTQGDIRCVVEAQHPEFKGMLHIYNPDQLTLA